MVIPEQTNKEEESNDSDSENLTQNKYYIIGQETRMEKNVTCPSF